MHIAEGNITRRIEFRAPIFNFTRHNLIKFEFFNDKLFSTKVALFLPKLHGRNWVSTKVAWPKLKFYQSYGNRFYQSYNSTKVALFYQSYDFFQSCIQTLHCTWNEIISCNVIFFEFRRLVSKVQWYQNKWSEGNIQGSFYFVSLSVTRQAKVPLDHRKEQLAPPHHRLLSPVHFSKEWLFLLHM